MRILVQEFRALWSAVLYFTRLPLPAPEPFEPGDLRRAAAYWPMVGAGVGLLVGLIFLITTRVLPAGLAAALGLSAGILFTGAMHEDGLADVCDGLGGGAGAERALEIMKDSRIGVFGATGLILSLLLRWQTLTVIPKELVIALLVAAQVSSRAAAASLMATQTHVRTGPSKARALVSEMGLGRLSLVLMQGLLPLAWLPTRLWPCLLTPLVLRVTMGAWYHRRLGGYTGDCLGALQQLGELGMLMTGIALL